MTVSEMRLETLQYHRNLHTKPERATIAPLRQLWHLTSLISFWFCIKKSTQQPRWCPAQGLLTLALQFSHYHLKSAMTHLWVQYLSKFTSTHSIKVHAHTGKRAPLYGKFRKFLVHWAHLLPISLKKNVSWLLFWSKIIVGYWLKWSNLVSIPIPKSVVIPS